jgi:hypothetical protein
MLLGTQIRATGTAENAKLGGVIVFREYPLYVEGVESWPTVFIGRKLEVIGTVDSIPAPSLGAAGIMGGGFILRDARWHEVRE